MLHKENAHVGGVGILEAKPLAEFAGGFCLDSTDRLHAQQAIRTGGNNGCARLPASL